MCRLWGLGIRGAFMLSNVGAPYNKNRKTSIAFENVIHKINLYDVMRVHRGFASSLHHENSCQVNACWWGFTTDTVTKPKYEFRIFTQLCIFLREHMRRLLSIKRALQLFRFANQNIYVSMKPITISECIKACMQHYLTQCKQGVKLDYFRKDVLD